MIKLYFEHRMANATPPESVKKCRYYSVAPTALDSYLNLFQTLPHLATTRSFLRNSCFAQALHWMGMLRFISQIPTKNESFNDNPDDVNYRFRRTESEFLRFILYQN